MSRARAVSKRESSFDREARENTENKIKNWWFDVESNCDRFPDTLKGEPAREISHTSIDRILHFPRNLVERRRALALRVAGALSSS